MGISVVGLGGERYRVTVEDGGSSTVHEVTVTPADVARYAPGAKAEALVERSFEFLLEREPKESILPRFALPVIAQYFPEYPGEIGMRLGARDRA